MPNSTSAMSWIRSRSTTSSICAGSSYPGTSKLETIQGAAIQTRAAAMPIPRMSRFPMPEARRQAPERLFCVSRVANIGMKADAKAPPAIRLNKISGTLLAEKKASRETPVPKTPEYSMRLSRPIRLESANPAITMPAPRAIWASGERFTALDYTGVDSI